jgi:hypothetical protein
MLILNLEGRKSVDAALQADRVCLGCDAEATTLTLMDRLARSKFRGWELPNGLLEPELMGANCCCDVACCRYTYNTILCFKHGVGCRSCVVE